VLSALAHGRGDTQTVVQTGTHGVFYLPPVDTLNDARSIAKRSSVQPVAAGTTDMWITLRRHSGYAGGFAGQGQNLDTVTIVTNVARTSSEPPSLETGLPD
jgi:hypothetical protein